MPEYLAPGVFVEETSFRSKSIEGVSTSTTAFVGPTRTGPVGEVPELITMNAFGLLIEPTDEIGLFFREVLMKHFDFTVRLPRPELFTKTFDAAYEARYVDTYLYLYLSYTQ